MIGRTLGHYRVVEKLGEGGMGVIYKAHDTHLDRPVAVKVLRPDRAIDDERRRRFTSEAKAASALNHPNIVHIYDVDEADGTIFIAMELVAGKTLDQRIPRRGLPLREALGLAIQIADALAAAHAAGIVHRDLKPENVMVSDDGHVKILDFGLAKLFETALPSGSKATLTRPGGTGPLTGEGVIVGTAAYMSPEQAEAKSVDHRSDIFSYGAVLYEMASGQRAFQGGSLVATLSSILHREPKPLREVGEGIPPDLERIIARCLRKDPDRRFQHMSDLRIELQELEEAVASGGLGAPRLRGVQAARARKLAFAAGSAALALAALLVSGRRMWRSNAGMPAERVVQLTSYSGSESEPSFSPDGTEVVFTWGGQQGGNLDIYRKLIGPGEPLRLTSHPADDLSPTWSPDGRLIAFVRAAEHRQVLVVPALGGPERTLAQLSQPRFALELRDAAMIGPYLAWTPDGSGLVVMDRARADDPFGLFLLSTETGEKRPLTFPPAGTPGDTGASISPDGRSLAFVRHSGSLISDLYVVALTADYRPQGEPRRLTYDACRMGNPAWTPDGREIVFHSERPGTSRLWRLAPARFDPPRAIATVGRVGRTIAVSRRGSRLAYTEVLDQRQLWRFELEGADGRLGPLRLFASSASFDAAPRFSPDGRKVAFHSWRSGNNEIWTIDATGNNLLQLTSFSGPVTGSPRWSPDGRQLVFDSRPGGNADVFAIDADGGKPRRLTSDPAEDFLPSWSRDGRWIYFCSRRTGERQIWKMPTGGGAAVQVTRKGGFAASESTDGKFLYYAPGPGPTSLWRVPVDGGEEVRVIESLGSWSDFDVVFDGIYFVPARSRASEYVVQFHRFSDGKTATLGRLEKEPYGLSASPDRRTLICSLSEAAGSDLMLIENFR